MMMMLMHCTERQSLPDDMSLLVAEENKVSHPIHPKLLCSSEQKRYTDGSIHALRADISPGGGLGQGSASSAGAVDEGFIGFFALFPMEKVRSAGQVVSAQLGGHVSSSALSAHQMARAGEPVDSDGSDVWVMMRDGDTGKTYCWNRRTNSFAWEPPAGVEVVWVGELAASVAVCGTATRSLVSLRIHSLRCLLGGRATG